MRFKVPFLAMALLAVAALSVAQDPGQGGQGNGGGRRQGGGRGGQFGQFGRGGGMRLTQLLKIEQVQTELKVTDDQKTKIADLPGGFGGGRPGGGGGNGGGGNGGGGNGGGQRRQPPTAEEQLKQLADDKAATSAILTPDQEKRLEEIRIQVAGPNAVTLPDVQAALTLTDDQKSKIADLQSKLREATQGLMQQMRDGSLSREDLQPAMQKNNDTFAAEVKKVLTADQQTKLTALGGAPFKLEVRRRGGGNGGRG